MPSNQYGKTTLTLELHFFAKAILEVAIELSTAQQGVQ